MTICQCLKKDFPLSKLTTLGIGGTADFVVEVRSIDQLKESLSFCQENQLPFLVLGKGSNSLFTESGFRGLIIVNRIDFFHSIDSGCFRVGAGYSFSLLGTKTAQEGWAGLEFASGIPASVGGAVFMNAGANGSETADTLVEVEVMTVDGRLFSLKKSQMEFGYRYSSFQKTNDVIVSATFMLRNDSEARAKQLKLLEYRKSTQPYQDKSAGCVFRNPIGQHAGALIEKCGLKGKTIGGAQVSEKHANFLINKGQATFEEFSELVNYIQKTVYEKTGIMLEPELRQHSPFLSKDK